MAASLFNLLDQSGDDDDGDRDSNINYGHVQELDNRGGGGALSSSENISSSPLMLNLNNGDSSGSSSGGGVAVAVDGGGTGKGSGGVTTGSSTFGRSGASSSVKYNVNRSSGKTPGTSRTNLSSSNAAFVIASIVAGRGLAKGEIGLTYMDLRLPEVHLSQFSDTSAYSRLRSKLHALNPVEVVLPETAVERGGHLAVLVHLLQDELPHTQISTIHRKYFSDAVGLERISSMKIEECSTLHKDLHEKYYSLASTAALFKYVEFIQNMAFAPASVKIVYEGVQDACMIDPLTIKHLELIVSSKDERNADASLFGVLNGTFSVCGTRLLRSSIFQPPIKQTLIEHRLDAVQELLHNEQGFRALRHIVSRLLDIDQLVSLCVHVPKQDSIKSAEYKLTQIIHLKHTLELVPSLTAALEPFENTLFTNYYQNTLADTRFQEIIEHIAHTIDDDIHMQKGALAMRTQRCFAVKANVNGMLDVARRTYTELVNDVHDCVMQAGTMSGHNFRSAYSSGRGFHLTLSHNPANRVSQCYNRINQSVNEIMMISNGVACSLLNVVRGYVGCLYNLTECMAVVDMLTAIAHYCSLSPTNVVRPEFTNTLAIKQGVHPLLQHVHQRLATANDTYLSDECTFAVITGPNMAGKSTYLKQVALLQILAQIGSFVPAEYASVRLVDQIFSRIGHNDDLQSNSSAFMVEMRDINYITRNMTSRSLVLVDELGRSTSTEEGIGICHAICEFMIHKKAFVLFATHFLDLNNLDSLYPNVQCYHFGAQQHEQVQGRAQLHRDHQLRKGPYKGPLYGFELAEVACLPAVVVQRAKEFTELMVQQRQERQQTVDKKLLKERAVMRLGHRLCQAVNYAVTDREQLKTYLQTLKQSFIDEMNELSSTVDNTAVDHDPPQSHSPHNQTNATNEVTADGDVQSAVVGEQDQATTNNQSGQAHSADDNNQD